MTAPNMAEKVCRGTPSQSAQVPYSVVSSISVSPTSNTTARTLNASGCAGSRTPPGSDVREALIQVLDRRPILPRSHQLTEVAQALRAGRIPRLAQRDCGLARHLATLVDLAIVDVGGRKVGEEHGPLLHGHAIQHRQGVVQDVPGFLRFPGSQVGESLEPLEPVRVVVVHPGGDLTRGHERTLGSVDGEQRRVGIARLGADL